MNDMVDTASDLRDLIVVDYQELYDDNTQENQQFDTLTMHDILVG